MSAPVAETGGGEVLNPMATVINFPSDGNPADYYFTEVTHPDWHAEPEGEDPNTRPKVTAVYAVPKWVEIDEELYRIHENGTTIAESAKVDESRLGGGVLVLAGAEVISSSVGDNVTIGEKAKVTRSQLGNGVDIGCAAQVARSSLGKDVIIGENAVLHDTTLGPDTKIGHRAQINNIRAGNNVTIGNYSRVDNGTIGTAASIGDSVDFVGDIGPRATLEAAVTTHRPSTIGADAQIGRGVNFQEKVHVGVNAIVLPHVRLVRDVPDNAVAVPTTVTSVVRGDRTTRLTSWLSKL